MPRLEISSFSKSRQPLMTFRHPCHRPPVLCASVTLLAGAQLVEHSRWVVKWTGERLDRWLLKTLMLRAHCNSVRCRPLNERRDEVSHLKVFADFAASFSSFSLFSF